MKKSEGFLIGGLIVAIALHVFFMGDWWVEQFNAVIATITDFFSWLGWIFRSIVFWVIILIITSIFFPISKPIIDKLFRFVKEKFVK